MSLERALELRSKPGGVRPAMFQRWSELSFLHWEVPISDVQRLLPDGLQVDTFEGKTYVGLVLFTMSGIRLVGLPEVPGTNAFHETNVRVYVVDEQGRPGVWFCSLEAANRLAVEVARRLYRLPYHYAEMSLDIEGERVAYKSNRLESSSTPAGSDVAIKVEKDVFEAQPGTLEFFLAERYLLFARGRKGLQSAQVHHTPYPLQNATCLKCSESLVQAADLNVSPSPKHVMFSAGVDVDVYSLRDV